MKRKNENGQGLLEYLILTALVAVAAIAVVSVVGTNLREQYAKMSHAIRGERVSEKMTKPEKDSYRRRGMDDFSESAFGEAGR